MSAEPGLPRALPEGVGPVEWTFDPWSERPFAAVVAALAVLGFWLAIAAWRLPAPLALAMGAVAASPLLPAFVPAACRVGREGAARRGLLGWARRGWAEVRRVEDVPVGVLLSPYTERHWLDATRALTLPMPAPRREELRLHVRRIWGANGG